MITQQVFVWSLLALCVVVLAVFLKEDLPEYRHFKTLTETADRQRQFRKWIVKSAWMFGGTAIPGLVLLRHLGALTFAGMPVEFAPMVRLLPAIHLGEHFGGFLIGVGLGVVGAGIVIAVAFRLFRKKKQPAKLYTLGDIAPLLPRNNAERVWALLISLNAGWCEELFFRLFLPLLITLATGNAVIGFGAAVIVFGLVHFYQGFSGILATTVLGALLTAIYLVTGNIWIAAGVHALVDINGLIVQPLLLGRRDVQ